MSEFLSALNAPPLPVAEFGSDLVEYRDKFGNWFSTLVPPKRVFKTALKVGRDVYQQNYGKAFGRAAAFFGDEAYDYLYPKKKKYRTFFESLTKKKKKKLKEDYYMFRTQYGKKAAGSAYGARVSSYGAYRDWETEAIS